MADLSTGERAAAGALTELLVEEDMTHKSLIPDDVIIRDYLSCINDDTWVRHAELVRLSDLKESDDEEVVKQEVLRTFIEERRQSGADTQKDPIMEGILWQEKFMEEYKRDHRSEDKQEAGNYKAFLMDKFRAKRGNQGITSGPTDAIKAIQSKGGQGSTRASLTNDSSRKKMNYPDPSGPGSSANPKLEDVVAQKVTQNEVTETAVYPEESEAQAGGVVEQQAQAGGSGEQQATAVYPEEPEAKAGDTAEQKAQVGGPEEQQATAAYPEEPETKAGDAVGQKVQAEDVVEQKARAMYPEEPEQEVKELDHEDLPDNNTLPADATLYPSEEGSA